MAGTMLQADTSTFSLKITSSHFTSVFAVNFSSSGTISFLHRMPAKAASRMAITTRMAWLIIVTVSPLKPAPPNISSMNICIFSITLHFSLLRQA